MFNILVYVKFSCRVRNQLYYRNQSLKKLSKEDSGTLLP